MNGKEGVRSRADQLARKADAAREGAKAWREYEAAGLKTRANTERLKALRLAKEAQVAAQEAAEPAAKKTSKRRAPCAS